MSFHILDLNDYCFLEIRNYLECNDAIQLALTCTALNRVVKDIYKKEYESWNIEDLLDKKNYVDFATVTQFPKAYLPRYRTINEWNTCIQQLENNTFLRDVTLEHPYISKDLVNTILNKICDSSDLSKLKLIGYPDLVLDNLHKFKHLKMLYVDAKVITNLVEVCKSNTNLIKLDLARTMCTHLADMAKYCTKLEHLIFAYDQDNHEEYEPLARITSLKELRIRSTSNISTLRRFFETLASKGTHTLTTLALDFEEKCLPLTDFTETFDLIGRLTSLTTLECTYTSPHQLQSLVYLKNLTKLELTQNSIHHFDVSEEILNILKKCTKLIRIYLYGGTFIENFTYCALNVVCQLYSLKKRSTLLLLYSDSPIIGYGFFTPCLQTRFQLHQKRLCHTIIYAEDIPKNEWKRNIQFKHLETLHIKSKAKSNLIISPCHQEFLRSLKHCSNLTNLCIDIENIFVGDIPPLNLSNLELDASLNDLNLICQKFSMLQCLILRGENPVQFSRNKHQCMMNLKELQFKTNENIKEYSGLPELPVLEVLKITGNHMSGTFVKLFQALSSKLTLKKLIINSENLSLDEIKEIACLKSLGHLSCHFSDFNSLAEEFWRLGDLPVLEELKITGNHYGGTFLKLLRILSSKKERTLKVLILGNKNLNSDEIVEIGSLKSLEHLSCHFSDFNGLQCLTQLPNLKYLDCEPTLEAYNKSITIPVCEILEACKLLNYLKLYSQNMQLISDAFEVLKRVRDRNDILMPLKMIVPEFQWEAYILRDYHPYMELDFIRPTSPDDVIFFISKRICINEKENNQFTDINMCSRFTHLQEIELNLNFNIADLIKLCHGNQNLRSLKLRNIDIDGRLCDIVPFCPNLQEFQFHTKAIAEEYELLGYFPKLTTLRITGDHSSGTFMKLLRALTARKENMLKSLIIESQYLNFNEMKEIGKLIFLEYLSCRYNNPTYLEFLGKLINLSLLELQPSYAAQHRCISKPLLIILKTCKLLNSVTIGLCKIGADILEHGYRLLQRVRNLKLQSPLKMYISDIAYNNLVIENKVEAFLPHLQIKSAFELQKTIKDMDLLTAKSVCILEEDINNLSKSPNTIQQRYHEFRKKFQYNNYLEVLSLKFGRFIVMRLERLSVLPVLTKLILHGNYDFRREIPKKLEIIEYNPCTSKIPNDLMKNSTNLRCIKMVDGIKVEDINNSRVLDKGYLFRTLFSFYSIRQITLDADSFKRISKLLCMSKAYMDTLKSLEHLHCHYSDISDLEIITYFKKLISLDICSTLRSDNSRLPNLLLRILRSCPLLEYIAMPYFCDQAKFFEDANSVLRELRTSETQEPLVIYTSTIISTNFEPYLKLCRRQPFVDSRKQIDFAFSL